MTTAAEKICYSPDDRLQLAKLLVTHLENGDEDDISRIINKLYTEKEQSLFQEIGKLTRQLHDAISNCRNDERITSIAEKEMPDARERLRYVMEKTDQSAHKTLGAVETALPLADQLKADACQMTEEWSRFKRREMSAEDFRKLSKKLEAFLDTANKSSSDIHGCLSEILLAQDFQDLTGQIICRVISIVEEVEQGLVGMIKSCGECSTVIGKTGPDIEAEGPQMQSRNRADVVEGQDAVDDLLSSLGF